jgi:hypothetical protein
MPKTPEKYIAVLHYEAGDPSATVFAIDDTARQAIAAAKDEEPDDDFVSFPATAALAAQIAAGDRLVWGLDCQARLLRQSRSQLRGGCFPG